MFGHVVKADCGVHIIVVCVCMEECACIRVHEHCPCSMRGCSDGDFKTLLNNSLQLHSALDARRGKSTDLALLKHI